jgi:hypothetical protein
MLASSGIVCFKRTAPPRCRFCPPDRRRPSVALCDHPLDGDKSCSAARCGEHRQKVGRDLDRCPNHFQRSECRPPFQESLFMARS